VWLILTYANTLYSVWQYIKYSWNNQMMLTTTQAAEKLNVHPETIRRLVKAGRLKAVLLNTSTTRTQLRIDEKELDAFIAGKS
jgi:excisionase family DNA binding protein